MLGPSSRIHPLAPLLAAVCAGALAACSGGADSGAVPPAVTVFVYPATPVVVQGGTQQFSGQITGSPDTSIFWSVIGTPSGSGSITAGGLYTAPNIPGTYTIVGTSHADPAAVAVATVTVPQVTLTLSPTSVSLAPLGSASFTASVGGTQETGVHWSVSPGGAGGSITAAGVYTAPPTGGTDTVVATSVSDPLQSVSAQVTIGAPVSVSVSPASATVNQGATQQFSATVAGTSNVAVTWSVQGPVAASISANGLFTAPPSPGTFVVSAQSVADPGRSASATVVVPPIAVTVNPAAASVAAGKTTSFTATVTGTGNTAVTWSVTPGGAGGSINAAGVYTAPAVSGTDTVVATSVADGSKTGQAVVTVTTGSGVSVQVTPASPTVSQGATQQFTAQVGGTSNTAVTWSVQGTGSGTITAQGLYTAPAGPGASGTYTVVAQSQADTSKTGTATITVSPITVTVAPATATLSAGQAQTFTATVTGAVNTAVTWSAVSGTIDSTGAYKAPSSGTSDTITAASVVDPGRTGTATVTIGQAETAVVPYVADSVQLSNFKGAAIAANGSAYVTGLLTDTKVFGSITLTSAGAGDVFIGKYNTDGSVAFAKAYGDAADQEPTAIATGASLVAAIGQFNGALGTLSDPQSYAIDYVLGIDPTTGNILWQKQYDLGLGGILQAVAVSSTGAVAVCGQAVQAATSLVPGATWGGLNDVVIGVLSSTGALTWSTQVGTANNEACSALAWNAAGTTLYAAGKYDGSAPVLGFTGTQLPVPGSSFRKHLWVASFNGATGAPIAQTSFGSGAGSHTADALAVDGSGNLFVSGGFTNSIPFGAFTAGTACTATQPGCLVSAGSSDGYVARLTSALAPVWALRLGGTGTDEAKGLAVDSFGNVTAVGVINGSTTVSSLTPTTVASAPVAALTTPSNNPAAFLTKLPGNSGVYNPATANVYGNATNQVSANTVSINAAGTGATQNLVVFGGTYNGTLNFGGTSAAISTTTGGNEDFLVFGKLQ